MAKETPPKFDASQKWTWNDTPNRDEKIFTVFVKTELIRYNTLYAEDGVTVVTPANAPLGELLAFGSTPYRAPSKLQDLDPAFKVDAGHLGVNTWDFIGSNTSGPTTQFHYFKDKTVAELNTPFKMKKKTGSHFWDPVLHRVWVEPDNDSPVTLPYSEGSATGTITGPTYVIKALITESISEGTRFTTRQYLRSTQPMIKQGLVPQPDTIKVVVRGPGHSERTFERMIHPIIKVDAVQGAVSKTLGSDGESGGSGGSGEQIFDATNVESRQKYTLEHDADQDQYGLWLETEVEVTPPKGARTNVS